MNTELLPVDLIRTLSMLLVITSVATVEIRRLRLSAVAYSIQALIIVALLASFAPGNPALYLWAATALLTKAILTPYFLFRGIGSGDDRELKPLIGFGPSVLVAVLLMLGFYHLTHTHVALLAPSELAQQELFRTNLAVASTVFALGLYAVLTRRDAIKTVIGLCLLENGVHLSLVSLAPGLPETALFGVASEVVVTVYLLLYVIGGVRREFGTTDTFALRELHW
jgi:hydrogenase-4 component E